MRRAGVPEVTWISPRQELILRAALSPPAEALDAWTRLRAQAEIDDLDPGSFRLLPLLYRSLSAAGGPGADLAVLRSVYRYSWYANQRMFARAGGALRLLEAEAIPTIVLKGAALSALHYRDAGTRPMDDVDVLVPPADAHRAIDVLEANGWSAASGRPHRRVAVHHSEAFEEAGGSGLDLHWHVLPQPTDDAALWSAAVPVTVGGAQTLALCPADQLLNVCVHGADWNPWVPSMRWVIDAWKVLESTETIDWDRLVSAGRDRGLTIHLATTLGYLERFGAPVPREVVGQLAHAPASRLQRTTFRAATRTGPSVAGGLWILLDRYRRLRRLDPPYPQPRGFVAFVNQALGFERPWQLPAYAVRKLAAAGAYRLR